MRSGFLSIVVFCLLLVPVFQVFSQSEGNLIDPGVLSDHGPVHINGDGQFDTDDSVVSGDGSEGDPYIIENWRINASTGHGIWIENTNAHFIIRNCKIFNGTYGIYLKTAKNGVVSNNLLIKDGIGIYLYSSSQNTFLNNTLNNSGTGIYIYLGSNDNIFENNDVLNGSAGISILASSNATFHNNTMANNTYNLEIFGGTDFMSHNHTITSDNTVDGKPVYYWIHEYNKKVPADAGFVVLIECDNITAKGLTIERGSPGILVFSSGNITVEDNVLDYAGVSMESSHHIVVSNNSITNATGILLSDSDNNTLVKNVISNNGVVGIRIISDSDWNLVANNVVSVFTSTGIEVYTNSDNNTIENNTVSAAFNLGIFIFYGSHSNHIINNTVRNTANGIYVQQSHFSDIRFNDLLNNTNCDIGLEDSNWTIVANNSIHKATRAFYLRPAFNTTITNNTVWEGIYSVAVGNSYDNLVFNNYLRGAASTWGTGTTTWNITKTLGRNIVGGPYLGGNYWQYYTGEDTNSDGLGDTLVPLWPGDYLPLIATTPSITDNTTLSPTTGDPFTIRADAWDDSAITIATAEAWVDEGAHTNLTMTRYSGDAMAGNYSAVTAIPTNATTLHYFLCAKDDAVNWNCTGNMSRTIVDNDVPIITDLTAGTPTTGENFTFNATVTDNIKVTSLNVEYWYNAGLHTNDTMAVAAGTCSWNVTAASNASWMHYVLKASDNSSNWASRPVTELQVTDNDLPVITDLIGSPTTGDPFTMNISVTDNVSVSEVRINFRFDALDPVNVTMTPSGGTNFTNTTQVPTGAKMFRYLLWAMDNSSNIIVSGVFGTTVGDNDAPKIKDLTGKPTTGDPFDIVANITDNVNVASITFNYSSDDGTRGNLTISPTTGNLFKMNLTLGKGVKLLNYTIAALDDDGNPTTFSASVQVKDNDAPELLPLSTNPTTGDNFTFRVAAMDNIDVASAWLEYWFDQGAHVNISLQRETGSPTNLSGTLMVPAWAKVMSFTTSSNDTSGNWILLKESSMNILDNDAPEVEDRSGTPETGTLFEFVAEVSDNIALAQVMVNYSFGTDGNMVDYMTYSGTVYRAEVSVPDNATLLNYSITAMDVSGNKITSPSIESKVTDIESPFISFASDARPDTGMSFLVTVSATDNIGVAMVWLDYWFGGAVPSNTTMTAEGDGLFTATITIPADATVFHAFATAVDAAGNRRQTIAQLQLEVDDVLPPSISMHPGSPVTGDQFVLAADIADNIGIDMVELEYWFDQGSYEVVVMTEAADGTGTYEAILQVPEPARRLNFLIKAYDGASNLGSLFGNTTTTDDIAPTITDRTNFPTTGDQMALVVEVTDNWEVSSTSIEYWFDEGTKTSFSYTGPRTVLVPDTARKMYYTVLAEDAQGNLGDRSFIKDVRDNDLPNIEDRTEGKATRGKDFTVRAEVTDNTDIMDIYLEYWTDGPVTTIDMEEVDDGIYEAVFKVGGEGDLHYTIYAVDTGDNTEVGQGGTVSVKEGDGVGMLPIFMALLVLLAGSVMVGMFLLMRSRDREIEAQWRAQARRMQRKEKVKREEAAAVVLPDDDEEERERKAWLARNIVFKKAAMRAEEDLVRRRREGRTRWETTEDAEEKEAELKALQARNIVFKKAARLAQEQLVRRNKEKNMERGMAKERTDGGNEGERKVVKKVKKKRKRPVQKRM